MSVSSVFVLNCRISKHTSTVRKKYAVDRQTSTLTKHEAAPNIRNIKIAIFFVIIVSNNALSSTGGQVCSAVLDFKNSENIHTKVKPLQIAYSTSSGTFSLEVQLKSKKGILSGKSNLV